MQYITAELKVKGGKLVRVRVAFDESIVFQVQITGDFFIHPEDGLDAIENVFIGMRVPPSPNEIERLVNEVVTRGNMKIMGFSPNDLAALVAGAFA